MEAFDGDAENQVRGTCQTRRIHFCNAYNTVPGFQRTTQHGHTTAAMYITITTRLLRRIELLDRATT